MMQHATSCCDNNFAFDCEPKRRHLHDDIVFDYFRCIKKPDNLLVLAPAVVCRSKVVLCPAILIMKNTMFLWFVAPFPLLLISIMPSGVQAECFGDLEYDFGLTCREQYQDCESCVAGTILHASCHGWCPESRKCAGGFDDYYTIVSCDADEIAYEDWCPVDTVNPAFNNERCIAVSWEQYYCNQNVGSVGCDENYVNNYCTLDNRTSTQLCNGQGIGLMNMRYLPPFGRSIGYFQKNPAGVKVQFGPGSGLWTSACYKFNYKPIEDAIICAAGDNFALKYTLAPLGGRALSTESTVVKKTTTTSHLRQTFT
jgi:hypothetical protein